MTVSNMTHVYPQEWQSYKKYIENVHRVTENNFGVIIMVGEDKCFFEL